MKRFFRFALLSFGALAAVSGQQALLNDADTLEREIERQAVPAEVLAEAVKEVQIVGDQTLKGDFEGVIAKMYPRFRQRSAKKLGGNAELAATMAKMINDLAASGITITKFTAEPAIHGFDIPEFREWLVFVPTSREVRRIDPETGLVERRRIRDYQIAIRKKAADSPWSFLNGSTLDMQELRSLFPSLPTDIQDFAVPPKSAELLR